MDLKWKHQITPRSTKNQASNHYQAPKPRRQQPLDYRPLPIRATFGNFCTLEFGACLRFDASCFVLLTSMMLGALVPPRRFCSSKTYIVPPAPHQTCYCSVSQCLRCASAVQSTTHTPASHDAGIDIVRHRYRIPSRSDRV